MSTHDLASLTAQIGQTQGELRAMHLKYHLTTAALLTSNQMHRYSELRGYRWESRKLSLSSVQRIGDLEGADT